MSRAPEVGVEEGELAVELAVRCRPRRVPDDLDAMRQRPRRRALRDRQLEREVALAVALFGGDRRRRAVRGQAQRERLPRQHGVVAGRAGDEAAAGLALEAQAERCRADQLGRRGGAGNAQRHRQRVDAIGIAERHLQPARRRLDDAQLDGSRLARQERVDAQLVVVADRRLQQARVDAAPRDVLEHLLRARLLDRHGGAQLAVDVEGEAAHDLAGRERELKLALEDAVVGIEEDHLHPRLGGAAGDLDVDLQRRQPHRLLGALHLQHRRAPGRDRRRRRHGQGRRNRRRLCPGEGAGHAGGTDRGAGEPAGGGKA